MLKLDANLYGAIEEIVDAIDLRNGSDIPIEEGQERDIALTEVCLEQTTFANLYKVWLNATKMRNWL